MWKHSAEEWERRKSYLIRSLFEDLPILSPVPEADERLTPSPVLPSVARPYSPLPPLIIEPEPNRHDEPESFYTQLEKKMKRYYIKLFFENRLSLNGSEVGSHFDGEDDVIRHIEVESENNDTSDTIKENGIQLDHEKDLNLSGHEGDVESVGDFTDPSQSSSNPDYVQVTFEALVHVEASQQTAVDKPPSLVYDGEAGVWRDADIRVRCPDVAGTVEAPNVPKEIRVPDDINNDDSHEEPYDIERMRTPRNLPSVGSLQNEPYQNQSNSDNVSAVHKQRSLEAYSDSNSAENIVEMTDYNLEFTDNFGIRTSTPRCKKNCDQKLTNKRLVGAPVSTPNKRKKKEDVAVQTSFNVSTRHRNWRVQRNNFFIGTPKLFRLCSCRNHFCNC